MCRSAVRAWVVTWGAPVGGSHDMGAPRTREVKSCLQVAVTEKCSTTECSPGPKQVHPPPPNAKLVHCCWLKQRRRRLWYWGSSLRRDVVTIFFVVTVPGACVAGASGCHWHFSLAMAA